MFGGQTDGNQSKRRKLWTVLIALIVVLGVLVVVGIVASHKSKQAATTGTTTTSTTSNSPPSSSSASGQSGRTFIDLTGSGVRQTQPFTAAGNWTITYTFNCSNFGYKGNFQIDVFNTDGSDNGDDGANDLAMSGSATKTFSDTGEHYLSIHSQCNWHVVVKG